VADILDEQGGATWPRLGLPRGALWLVIQFMKNCWSSHDSNSGPPTRGNALGGSQIPFRYDGACYYKSEM
jgi:hypothetical protein